MAYEFDTATALTAVETDTAGETRFTGELLDGWDIGGVANGGYLLALAGRAVSEATGASPLTITAHYLRPGRPGPLEAIVTTVKSGRQFTAVDFELRRDGDAVIRGMAACGARPGSSFHHVGLMPPMLAAYDELPDSTVPADETGAMMQRPGLTDRLAVRMRHGDADFRVGRPTGRDDLAGWFAFADGRPIDELAVLLAVDAFAPAVFNMLGEPSWVPTIELTVHLRATPSPGPLRCAMRSDVVTGGFLNEDGTIWDSDGHLVAQSRQLGLLPRGS
ncbi:MAG: thioesterase family protein [Desertimonas sp.]